MEKSELKNLIEIDNTIDCLKSELNRISIVELNITEMYVEIERSGHTNGGIHPAFPMLLPPNEILNIYKQRIEDQLNTMEMQFKNLKVK